jgi:calcium-independent phospholipase A2-gamma
LYKDFARLIFLIGTNPNSEPAAWSKLFNYTNLIKSGAFYKAETLLEVISKKIGNEVMIDTTMTESTKDVKVCFVSTLTSISPPQPYLFRNYNYPLGSQSRYYGDCRTRIPHALRASTAAPSYFEEYLRDTEMHQDGAIVANNPCAIAIHEAKCLWPDRPIECIVSIGTGSPSTKNVKNKGVMQSIMKTLVRAASK